MHTEFFPAKPHTTIPGRDPLAGPGQVDLSRYYTTALDDNHHNKPGNTLASLPKGLQTLGGTSFDLRGLIQLAGARSREITGLVYPESVMGIPVRTRGTRIHFLHASAWDIEEMSVCIGEYVLHFANGESLRLPIVYKTNIWDWWSNPIVPDGVPVWKGQNERTEKLGEHIRLFRLSVDNPHPGQEIVSLDFTSKRQPPAPFLVAVTVDSEARS
jgi:hypothetical protein